MVFFALFFQDITIPSTLKFQSLEVFRNNGYSVFMYKVFKNNLFFYKICYGLFHPEMYLPKGILFNKKIIETEINKHNTVTNGIENIGFII
jgi:hypothetical protein